MMLFGTSSFAWNEITIDDLGPLKEAFNKVP